MSDRLISAKTAVTTLGCLVLAYAIYWLATSLEYYRETIELGWNAEARRNPYLAAEQFLSAAGLNVTASESLGSVQQLPAGGTLFISNSSQVLGSRHLEKLLDWIHAGGHVIVAAHDFDGERDPLLNHFEVALETTDCGCDRYDAPPREEATPANRQSPPDQAQTPHPSQKLSEIMRERNREARERNRRAAENNSDASAASAERKKDARGAREEYENSVATDRLTRLLFKDVAEELTVHFSPYRGLSHPSFDDRDSRFEPLYWTGSDYGYHFIQFDVGEGLISVLSDANIWHSRHIDEFDHAHLLTVLTGLSREVVLLYGGEYPSLWQLLTEHAPESLVALALWLAAWLVHRARRFGPVRRQSVTTRRSMAEHIYACADFLWRNDRQRHLLETVRDDTLHRIQRRYPAFARLDKDARVQLISEHTEMSPEEVQTALFAAIPKEETQFTHTITLLQTLWKTL